MKPRLMMLRQNDRGNELLVRSYASLLQQHLDIAVLPADLYWGGVNGPVESSPSSILTVSPFAPGGIRRFVLNARNPLILELAKMALNPKNRDAVLEMGVILLWTTSWPAAMDIPCGDLIWKTARGLISGPHWNILGPIPYEEAKGIGERSQSQFVSLAIWPRRIHGIILRPSKAINTRLPTKQITLLGEKWEVRDQLLWKEWRAIKQRIPNSTLSKTPAVVANPRRVQLDSNQVELITHSPALPLIVLAQYLQQREGKDPMSDLIVPQAEAMSAAAKVLLTSDKLFCLSIFFGVPLFDRTMTLKGALRMKRVVRPTPSASEVKQYLGSLKSLDPIEALDEAMISRAREIWKTAATKHLNVVVCWSGGIDSTAVLVCLLRTAANSVVKLRIMLDDESIDENPSFFNAHIEGKLKIIRRNDRSLSELAKVFGNEALLITGELGDQLFGSDLYRGAFEPDPLPPLSEIEASFIKEEEMINLSDPWEEVLLPHLENRGLLAGGFDSWVSFFKPQLEQSPVSIKTMRDFLWWMNFSMKWQNVSLRCLHDGGGYSPDRSLIGVITHFFDDRNLEYWSCSPQFHESKFPDPSNWETYKEPLKRIIFDFHPDRDYYEHKKKTGSLNFPLEGVQKDLVERILGLVQNSRGSASILSSGVSSYAPIHRRDLGVFKLAKGSFTNDVAALLEPWILTQRESTPQVAKQSLLVNPWQSNRPSPFEVAPEFADNDERQRRIRNPITAITLHGKCSALLPPDLVRGKVVLDVGACLGAMCHWSLYYGAKHATGVEPQQNFCHRMKNLLQGAETSWPTTPGGGSERFAVVCAEAKDFLSRCADQSFDVIVIAGVLHCFQDPVAILMELARVGKTVCIESVHPTYFVSGFNQVNGALSTSSAFLELAESAAVNKAGEDASFTGMTVVPSEQLMDLVMSSLGFDVVPVKLAPHPTNDADVQTYTGNRRFHASPVRFFLRCTRKTETLLRLRSLEDCVRRGTGGERQWSTANMQHWTTGNSAEKMPSKSKNNVVAVIDESPDNSSKGTWVFDKAVAARFSQEAMSHIPDYKDVIQSCLDAVTRYFGFNALSQLHAVDVGCAIGYTMIEMLRHKIGNVYGYDVSKEMLDVANENLARATESAQSTWSSSSYHLFLADNHNEVPPQPPAKFSRGDLDVVMMNWTLHFIVHPEDRLSYLKQLRLVLKEGGMLLLTEKTEQDETTRNLYYEWKASSPQNVSWEVINKKRTQLKGVLETLSVGWYLQALEKVGFENISVLRAKFGFVTFICYNPKPSMDIITEKAIEAKPFISWKSVGNDAASIAFDGTDDESPFVFGAWSEDSSKLSFAQEETNACAFGYVLNGEACLRRMMKGGKVRDFTLDGGMYFSCPGRFEVQGGCGIVSVVPGSQALFNVGGPLGEGGEPLIGRLPYIDGGTDTLLISPVVKGAPCLNHLHFPTGVKQTQHTHPSGRTGIIIHGRGLCRVVDPLTGAATLTPLEPGVAFCIPTDSPHAFETHEETLDVIAFHPDSDFGPTAQDHPMINRTIVDGLSASLLPGIQTKSQSR